MSVPIKLFCFSIVIAVTSCTNPTPNNIVKDKDSSSSQNKISDTVKKTINDTEEDDENPNPVDSQLYRITTAIDTSFIQNDIKYRLLLNTKFDSAIKIIVPKKYVKWFDIQKFEVYESFTRIKIFKKDSILIDTIIRKNDYSKNIDLPLKMYGNLMFPAVYYEHDSLEIKQSLSIPMTDIGIPVSSKFGLK